MTKITGIVFLKGPVQVKYGEFKSFTVCKSCSGSWPGWDSSDLLGDLLDLGSCRISLPGSKVVCKSNLGSWPGWSSSDWLKFCSIWGLAGFHFLVPKLYANLVLAHDLIETVLICWYSAQFRILQDFISWCEECARTLQHIVLLDLGLNVAVKFSDCHFHNSMKCHFSILSMGCSWPRAGALTGYCQLEPAEPRSHIVGRVNSPWSSTFRCYPLPIKSSSPVGSILHSLPFKSP